MVQSVRGVLPPVEYGFRSAGWRGAPWHVRAVELHEALSEPYRMSLELVVDDLDGAIDPLLGAGCELTIGRGAAGRSVCGLVLELDDLGVVGGRRLVRAQVGPALALLGQRVNTRAWQDRSALEVLEAVLGEGLAPYRRALRVELERGEYPRRDYCTQFRESDLEFAARLLAEEGISYYFEHEGGVEVMVLVDHNARLPALSGRADGDALPVVDNGGDTLARESVQTFTWTRRLHSTSATTREFDFLRPDAPLLDPSEDPGREILRMLRAVSDVPEFGPVSTSVSPSSSCRSQVAERREAMRAAG